VTALDAFADRDQHPAVTARAVAAPPGRPFSVRTLAAAASRTPSGAVAYLSPLENHPDAVERLSRGRLLWGNTAEVLRSVRNPHRLAAALREAGLRAPRIAETLRGADAEHDWLQKPRSSGGGRDVRPWAPGMDLAPASYLQEYIAGLPCSVVFVAAAGRAMVFGLSYQLVGDPAFGAAGFQYCGSIVPPDRDPLLGRGSAIAASASRLADAVAAAFELVGVNGIDFIAGADGAVAVEVNPRWCASMELVDRAQDAPVFDWHVAACTTGVLPPLQLGQWQTTEAQGKAVVFARDGVTVGDSHAWLGDRTVGDVPRAGSIIAAGSPVCTVFASGPDVTGCRSNLARRACDIYAVVDRWRHRRPPRRGGSSR
jgi:predicted ATP-grasp superfamily ATP-dependent carboligase